MKESQIIGTSTEAERMREKNEKRSGGEEEESRKLLDVAGDPKKMKDVLDRIGGTWDYCSGVSEFYRKKGLSKIETSERGADAIEGAVADIVEKETENFEARGKQIPSEITKSAERLGVDPEIVKAVIETALKNQKQLEIEVAAERDKVIITIRPEKASETPKPEITPEARPEALTEKKAAREIPAEVAPEASAELSAEIQSLENDLELLDIERGKLLLEKDKLQKIDFETVSGPERNRIVTRLWDEIPGRLLEIAKESLDLRASLVSLRQKTKPSEALPETPRAEVPPEKQSEVVPEIPKKKTEIVPEVPEASPEVPEASPEVYPEVPKEEAAPEKPEVVPKKEDKAREEEEEERAREKEDKRPEITPEEARAAVKETETAAAKLKEFNEQAAKRLEEIEEKINEQPAEKTEMMKAIKEKAKAFGEKVKNGLEKGVEKVKDFLRKAFEAGKNFVEKVPEKAANAAKTAKGSFKKAISFMARLFKR